MHTNIFSADNSTGVSVMSLGLVDDDAKQVAAAVRKFVDAGLPRVHRSQQVQLYRDRIAALDTAKQFNPLGLREQWGKAEKTGGLK